jgi:hypothetical protein
MVCSTVAAFNGVTGGSGAVDGDCAFETETDAAEAMARTAAGRNFMLILIDTKRSGKRR